MNIEFDKLQQISKDESQKRILVNNNDIIRSNFYPFSKKYLSYLENLNSYEIASIMLEMGHWEKSRKKSFDKNTKPYRYARRDIVLVNLGASNYGYEASYRHPCIVYANDFNWLLVIPCSTGRYKVNSPFILKGEPTDGFQQKTGIQLDKIRVIDKWRIQGDILGRVSSTKFQEITSKLLELYMEPVNKRIKKLDTENKQLQNDILSLNEKIKELEEQVQKLK